MSQHKSPWKTVSVIPRYTNPWIQVDHHEVITPKGSPGVYGVVHFKNHAVGVIPIDNEGNTWLVRQTRYVLGEQSWEIPEGGVPKGEAPLDGAKRELEEEVGLRAHDWETFLEMDLSNSVTDERATVFVARDLYEGKQALEDSEDIEVFKLPIQQAVEMVLDGKITDAISVAALLKWALLEQLESV